MDVACEQAEGMVVFAPEGRIDSAGSIQLDAAIRQRLGPEDRAVLFDMTGVSYISSAGIRVLFALEKMLHGRGGRLHLCAVRPEVQKVISLTGFDRVFSIAPTRESAVQQCRLEGSPIAAGGEHAPHHAARTRLFTVPVSDSEAVLRVTGAGDNACAGISGHDDLIPRIFAPGEYSLGTGAPGEPSAESMAELGLLLTAGGAIFWKPKGSTHPADFLIPRPDAPRVLLSTGFSVAADGPFHEIVVAEPVSPDGVSTGDLLRDIIRHARAARNGCPPVISILMYARTAGPGSRPVSENREGAVQIPEGKTIIAEGVCIDTGADLSAYDREALDAIFCQETPGCRDGSLFLYLGGLLFDAPPVSASQDITRLVADTVAEKPCTDLLRLPSGTLLSRTVIGVRYISRIEHTDRMPVRTAGECPGWNRTYETLTRWMHPGCQEVTLTPLTGGYSGTLVFRVSARDSRGRLMMPLVMKLGKRAVIEAEIRGYTDHVKRYIQNNATRIIETERIGEYGGILYNFVGIRGEESTIFSLEDFYLSHTADEILPVFATLFNVVLKGWYSEPKKKEVALYQEYNRFFTYEKIRAYAASRFGAGPDTEEVVLPFGLGRSKNPIWFVENVMPRRLNSVFSVYESSVHGDLNMKNVLMDETGNLWLIDFAETRYSHILRDIVKLEAVLAGEMVPVESREALEELVRLYLPFLSGESPGEIADLPAEFPDPAAEKAFRVIRALREHADDVTLHDEDISHYYLGLLQYTLNMLSYVSVNEYQKEFAWIVSSVLCRRLVEHGT